MPVTAAAAITAIGAPNTRAVLFGAGGVTRCDVTYEGPRLVASGAVAGAGTTRIKTLTDSISQPRHDIRCAYWVAGISDSAAIPRRCALAPIDRMRARVPSLTQVFERSVQAAANRGIPTTIRNAWSR